MLLKASVIRHCELVGSDATFGNVEDLYFDEYGWRGCYLAVDTGGLISDEHSLVPVSYVESSDWQVKRITVRMMKQSLADAASTNTDRTVDQQLRQQAAGYVAWPPPDAHPKGSTSQVPLGDPSHPGTDEQGRPLLRSAKAVDGYAVETTDGLCGHVEDLLVDDKTWKVEFLLVNPRNFLPGTSRLVPVSHVQEIDWLSHCVRMNVSKQQVRDCQAYEKNSTIDYLINSVFP